jgi:hypothetical protein
LAILLISAKRVESLAEADWEEKDRKAMVARIARITMTTMSSTRVNQDLIELFIILKSEIKLITLLFSRVI